MGSRLPLALPGAALAAGVLLLVPALGGCTRPPPPNVVVLSVDTLRRDALRAFSPSAPPQPALEAFAREAVAFDLAASTSSWTLPAHASLLTGLYPDRHGATDPRLGVIDGSPALAAALAAAGYETVAFTDEGLVSRRYGLGEGFERYDGWAALGAAPLPLPRDGAPEATPGETLFDRALAFLDQRTLPSRPFFLFLHTYQVHNYMHRHPWATAGLGGLRPSLDYLRCGLGEAVCSGEDWRALETLYRREVEHLDRAFGRLVERLRSRGLLERTLVVVLSDHGEGFDPARERVSHTGRLHEDLLRIPLLVRVPGARPGRVAAPVSLVDVMPTLLDWAGASAPPGLDGVSFAAALRGGAAPREERALLAFEHCYSWQGMRRSEAAEVRAEPLGAAVVTPRLWYIREGGREQAYDLRDDPAQTRDLAASVPLEPLRRAASARGGAAPGAPLPADPQHEEQLRSLGYIR